MKTLVLLRHAKSSWDDPGLPDFERQLNPRGLRDASVLGQRLAARGFQPDRIVVSPAQRSRQTATLVAAELGCEELIEYAAEIYEASLDELLKVISNFDDGDGIVLLVGHNPGISELAAVLLGTPYENLPTCGMVSTNFSVGSWRLIEEGGGVEVLRDTPKAPLEA
ncbi:MAG: hypothetical protein C0616_15095 [Desulfuromonas sp.]|nr:MAG: hypothetical protein C0616_15095 [Desulfuromonas sp.]